MLEPVCRSIVGVLGLPVAATTVLPGPTVGGVIPDVLIAQWQTGAACYRGTITHIEASILAHISNRESLTVPEFLERVFLSPSAAERAFRKLRQMGLIESDAENSYRLLAPGRADCLEVIAVELKLRRWREALAQGKAYKVFADQSYVVLDANQISLNEAVFQEFESANVGLLLHGKDRLWRVIRCQSRVVSSPERFIAAQKLKRAETWNYLPAYAFHV